MRDIPNDNIISDSLQKVYQVTMRQPQHNQVINHQQIADLTWPH